MRMEEEMRGLLTKALPCNICTNDTCNMYTDPPSFSCSYVNLKMNYSSKVFSIRVLGLKRSNHLYSSCQFFSL